MTDQSMVLVGNKEDTSVRFTNSSSMLQVQPRNTLASIESLTIPLVQEIVLLADFRCSRCQKRIAKLMSKMNEETDSIEVSVLEKKVTLTGRYSGLVKVPEEPVTTVYRNRMNKLTMIMRLFPSTFDYTSKRSQTPLKN